MATTTRWKNTLQYFLRRITPFFAAFLFIQIILRTCLFVYEFDKIDLSPIILLKALADSLLFDIVTFIYFVIPMAVYLTFLPRRFHLKPADKLITKTGYGCFLYILLFDAVAEWIFWDEFGARFNFIAVDYLVYTREVIGNIHESYPLALLLSAVGIGTILIYLLSSRFLLPDKLPVNPFRPRAAAFSTFLVLPFIAFYAVDLNDANISENRYVNEIVKDGIYSLFSAYIKNDLDYMTFYPSTDAGVTGMRLRDNVASPNSTFLNDDPSDITRIIKSNGKEKRYNVIVVMMESMGSKFMASSGNKAKITQNLDRLTKEALFFSNLYSTGSRTVRGLEAVTLSLPPAPGSSVVKRPGNENLFSLGTIFKERGYDTKFIYGGYGYFDNMNYFFSHNGFDILDRNNFTSNEVTFSTVWGVCDENLYGKALQTADKSYQEETPFMYLLLTTSNHRPYTYPEGKIDIPSHTGRSGAVKYADFALGKFIEDAKQHPWFDNTIFVILADHSSGVDKTELNVENYHIPLMYYAPKIISPRTITELGSQIDVAPTLLGILNFSYQSRFYGNDMLTASKPRAFISNYQQVAYFKDDMLTILQPVKEYKIFKDGKKISTDNKADNPYKLDAVAYYQYASDWHKNKQIIR